METITRNLEDLLAFHVVASEGGFTKASEALGISKSLLSKQVKRLEASLRVQLLHRTTRRLTLTDEGATLLAYSEKILRISDDAGKRLREMTQAGTGTLRISAPVSFGPSVLPPLISELRKRLPGVRIDIDLSNTRRELTREPFDFAFRASETLHPDLLVKPLGRIRDVICASPAFLKRHSSPITPKQVARLDAILHSQTPAWNTWTLVSKTEEIRLQPRAVMTANHYMMMREMCLLDAGLARLPRYTVEEDLREGKLVALFSDFEISTHPLYLAYLRSEFQTAKHRLAKETILEWFARERRFFAR